MPDHLEGFIEHMPEQQPPVEFGEENPAFQDYWQKSGQHLTVDGFYLLEAFEAGQAAGGIVPVEGKLPRFKYQDDIEDAAEHFGCLKPVDYARIREIAPQLVYYRIRNKKLQAYYCTYCGNGPLIKVAEADAIFVKKQEV